MIVTCPSCETKFEIPDDKYRPGRKARCSNCGNVFVLPDLAEDVPPDAPASASFSADIDALLAQAAAGDSRDSGQFQEKTEVAEDEPEDDAKEENTSEAASPASFDDVVPPPPAKKKLAFTKFAFVKPGRKKLLLILGIVLVVALLGYGGAMVFSAFFAPQTLPKAIGQGEEAVWQVAVGRLTLEDVQQYRVENAKAGHMVVIEGAVVNNFDSPKDYILLEIALYDGSGKISALREQYCGVSLTDLQLRTFSKDAIESALKNEAAIVINNTNISPGNRVHFTSVFFNVPDSAYEFEVRISDVKDSVPSK